MSTIGYITTTLNWVGFFGTLFLAYYFYLKFRHKERLLLIEKNIDLVELYKKRKKTFPWVILGSSVLGLSIGTFVSILIFVVALSMQNEPGVVVLIFASISLSGAIGILIGNYIENKKK